MPKYLIAYHGGRQSQGPEQRAAHMARWKTWIEELGAAVINPGTPVGPGKLVTSSGVSEPGPDGLSGFSVVLADNMDEALEIAQRCPFLDIGTIELAEAMEMR
jgi:hypothetical protein